MKSPRWMTLEEVRTLHSIQLAAFGGASGLRDAGLLESALARPQHRFHYQDPRPKLAQLAASYAFGLIRNHPFVDGNKRIGLITAFAFLDLNGLEVAASEEDTYQVFIEVAAGSMEEEDLSRWLDGHSVNQ